MADQKKDPLRIVAGEGGAVIVDVTGERWRARYADLQQELYGVGLQLHVALAHAGDFESCGLTPCWSAWYTATRVYGYNDS